LTTFHDEVGAFLRDAVGAENVQENVTIRIGSDELERVTTRLKGRGTMEYKFAATVTKQGLTVKKQKDEGGESIELPCYTLTLTLIDDRAINVAARMAAFQGAEIVVDVEGNGRQLNLN